MSKRLCAFLALKTVSSTLRQHTFPSRAHTESRPHRVHCSRGLTTNPLSTMEHAPAADPVHTLVSELSNLSVGNSESVPSDPTTATTTATATTTTSATSNPTSAQMLNLGPIPQRSVTSLSVLSAPAPGASNAPPPTPAAIPDSPDEHQLSLALRECVHPLEPIEALLAAAQLRATNDDMLRALLPSIRREIVEMALSMFANMRADGDILDAEHALAEEVRRLQDDVTTGYIVRGKDGDVAHNDRQVPPDLNQRLDDLEQQSRESTDTSIDRAEGELESLATLVGEQGDPHNSADLRLAKRVQAAMQTLQVVREDHLAMKKDRLNRASALFADDSNLPPQQGQYSPQPQHLRSTPVPVRNASSPQNPGSSPYEEAYAFATGAKNTRTPGKNYHSRPPLSATPSYPVEGLAHVAAPFIPHPQTENPQLRPTELGTKPPERPIASQYPEQSPYMLHASELPQTMQSTPLLYSRPGGREKAQQSHESNGERFLPKRAEPASTPCRLSNWSEGAGLSQDQSMGRLPPRSPYPMPTSYAERYQSQEHVLLSYPEHDNVAKDPPFGNGASGRMPFALDSHTNPVSNEERYHAAVSSAPGFPAHANPPLDGHTAECQQARVHQWHPYNQQTSRLSHSQKHAYPNAPPQTRPVYMDPMSARSRPEYSRAEPHVQVLHSNSVSTTPELYPATNSFRSYSGPGERHQPMLGSHGAYAPAEERRRPMHTSDPPGFQESASYYSNQPPSPDVRTPPPEYASGRPHSLSLQSYPAGTGHFEVRTSAAMYHPRLIGQPVPLEYPPGVLLGSATGLGPTHLRPDPNVYQPPRPEDVAARPPYSSGYPMPEQQSYQSSNLYSNALTQDHQPSLHSRHSLPVYASGYGGRSHPPGMMQSHPQAPPHGCQQPLNPSDPYNTAPTYGSSHFADPAGLRRATTNHGSGHLGVQPPKYGGQGTSMFGGACERTQVPLDSQFLNQSQVQSGLSLNHATNSNGHGLYPQRRAPYLESSMGIQVGPQHQPCASTVYAPIVRLQDMNDRKNVQGGIPLTNNVYSSVPQPFGYGPLDTGTQQSAIPEMMPADPNMTTAAGLGAAVSGIPPARTVSGMAVPGGPLQHHADQTPRGVVEGGQYATIRQAVGEGLPPSRSAGRHSQLTAQHLDSMVHPFRRP